MSAPRNHRLNTWRKLPQRLSTQGLGILYEAWVQWVAHRAREAGIERFGMHEEIAAFHAGDSVLVAPVRDPELVEKMLDEAIWRARRSRPSEVRGADQQKETAPAHKAHEAAIKTHLNNNTTDSSAAEGTR